LTSLEPETNPNTASTGYHALNHITAAMTSTPYLRLEFDDAPDPIISHITSEIATD
jgi:hypothetical protein